MNFLRSNPTPESANTSPQSDVPWLISTGARVVATLSGLFGIAIGFLSLFSIFDTSCIFAGAILMVEGLFICLLEAPCFCTFLDFAYMPSTYFEAKPNWIKATLYLMFAVIPFFFCIGIMTFLACGFILTACALYLMMALGRKASLDEMRVKANLSEKPTAVLVNNEELPKGTDPPPTYRQSEATLANTYAPTANPFDATLTNIKY